jgi:GT2 family glycosyltransferase/glycosyltransferase involved in cell wall biosynthesis
MKKEVYSVEEYSLVAGSVHFDAEYYANNCPELGEEDPAAHYLRSGDLYNPSASFDGLAYLEINDDVRNAGLNPLVHYLRYGRAEGRRMVAVDPWRRQSMRREVKPPTAPSEDEWRQLQATVSPDFRPPVVDIIVPVYRNADETLRCIFSVKKSRPTTPFQLIVVDDCSPEPELSAALKRLADRGLFELHRSQENRGFVRTCNFAMSLHPERDVLLLNSDTEVFGDWLDRLRRAALDAPRIGTVTPLSNNAEICSYPRFIQNNRFEFELADRELDEVAATVNVGLTVEIPTGVGFCLYIRRECLDRIGLFDEESFGKGYGEENDLCRRAAGAGWSNVLAADVFVRHYGGSSFGSSKDARVQAAIATMERLHPGYSELIQAFLANDPVQPIREALDAGRVRRISSLQTGKTILYVTHSWGGGTERHVREMAKLVLAEGATVLVGRTLQDMDDTIKVEVLADADFPNMPQLRLRDGVEAGAAALASLGVTHVHVQHLAGFSEQASDFLKAVCGLAGLAYDVTLHDYMAVCPRITLIDGSGRYCGEPSQADCEACIQRYGSPFGKPFVWSWRERHERLLSGARKIFVPSSDHALRMARFWPQFNFVVRPHPERALAPPPAPGISDKRSSTSERRVGILGAIGPQKGSILLADVVKAARLNELPLKFVVVGYSDRDAELKSLGVEVTGPFPEGQGAELLRAKNVDLAWFPAVWPETYSYTLSDAIRAGAMPVAFDFGAIAERIRANDWGYLMELKLMLSPEAIALALANAPLKPAPKTNEIGRSYPDLFSSYYDLDNRSAAPIG